jgi:hypothetical protein
MQKMEFSQILAGDAGNPLAQVRARSVHTAKVRPGTHCASTQRVRPSEKLKKNQNKTNPKLTHPETKSQSQNQKNKPIFSKQSSHKGKDFSH